MDLASSQLPRSCLLRLQRAQEHLDALDSEIRAFLDSKPYKRVVKQDSKTREKVFSFPHDGPPERLSVIVSDCLHELRSCLDSLVFHLAGCPDDRKSRLEFPIFANEGAYGEHEKGYLEGVSFDAKAIIKRLQPYRRPDNWEFPWAYDPERHPLMLLHDFNRVDKHRTLHMTVPEVRGAALSHDQVLSLMPRLRLGSQEGDTDVLRVPEDMNVDITPTFEVAFENRWPTTDQGSVSDCLHRIYWRVSERTLPQFERFFEDGVVIAR